MRRSIGGKKKNKTPILSHSSRSTAFLSRGYYLCGEADNIYACFFPLAHHFPPLPPFFGGENSDRQSPSNLQPKEE